MNGERALAALVALCCVFAFGTAAASLDSSISSTPGDLVDPDYGGLPFDREDAAQIREEIEGSREDQESQSQQSKPSENGRTEPQPQSGQGDEQGAVPAGGSDDQESSSGSGPAERGLADRLWAFLLSLWPVLVVLIALALAYRYRARLRALLAALVGGVIPAGGSGREAEADPWEDLDPDNDVEHAWVTMVRSAGLSRPWTKTPGECAEAAVSSGMDPEGVRAITDAFQAVRYGGEPPTDRHERRAREGLQRLDAGRGVL